MGRFVNRKMLATEILIGRVISKEKNYQSNFEGRTIGGISNRIVISKSIKGELNTMGTISIVTGDSSNPCSFNFEIDRFYLIYSKYKFTNQCRRTKQINDWEDDDIKKLLGSQYPEPPYLPFPPPNVSTSLTEKIHYRFIHTHPRVVPATCTFIDDLGDLSSCCLEVSNAVSAYFFTHIDSRPIKQIIILTIDDNGNISFHKLYEKMGNGSYPNP